jgi:hypothetical protein
MAEVSAMVVVMVKTMVVMVVAMAVMMAPAVTTTRRDIRHVVRRERPLGRRCSLGCSEWNDHHGHRGSRQQESKLPHFGVLLC